MEERSEAAKAQAYIKSSVKEIAEAIKKLHETNDDLSSEMVRLIDELPKMSGFAALQRLSALACILEAQYDAKIIQDFKVMVSGEMKIFNNAEDFYYFMLKKGDELKVEEIHGKEEKPD